MHAVAQRVVVKTYEPEDTSSWPEVNAQRTNELLVPERGGSPQHREHVHAIKEALRVPRKAYRKRGGGGEWVTPPPEEYFSVVRGTLRAPKFTYRVVCVKPAKILMGTIAPFQVPWPMRADLMPFQRTMVDALLQHARLYGGGILLADPGMGKTYMMAAAAAGTGARYIMLVVTNTGVCRQTVESLKELFADSPVTVGAYYGTDKADLEEPPHILVTVINSAAAMPRTAKGTSYLRKVQVVLVDEMHHGSANMYMRLLSYTRDCARMGFTGTFERSDGRHKILRPLFGSVAAEARYGWLPVVVREVRMPRTLVASAGAEYHELLNALACSQEANDVLLRMVGIVAHRMWTQHRKRTLFIGARRRHMIELARAVGAPVCARTLRAQDAIERKQQQGECAMHVRVSRVPWGEHAKTEGDTPDPDVALSMVMDEEAAAPWRGLTAGLYIGQQDKHENHKAKHEARVIFTTPSKGGEGEDFRNVGAVFLRSKPGNAAQSIGRLLRLGSMHAQPELYIICDPGPRAFERAERDKMAVCARRQWQVTAFVPSATSMCELATTPAPPVPPSDVTTASKRKRQHK